MFFYLPQFVQKDDRFISARMSFINELFCNKIYSEKMGVIFFILLASLGGLLFSKIPLQNNIRNFASPTESLLKQEKQIFSLLGVKSKPSLMVVRGSNIQELLEREEKVIRDNQDVKLSGISSWVPSFKNQTHSNLLYDKLDSSKKLIQNQINKDVAKFSKSNYKISVDTWLERFSNTQQSQSWIGQIKNHYYSIIQNFDPQMNLTFDTTEVKELNRIGTINKSLDKFSYEVGKILFIIVGLVFLFFVLRFGTKEAFWILIPSCLSIVISLSFIGHINGSLHLFHLLGSVLVLVLGLDYSFFYFFNKNDNTNGSFLTSKSVLISSLTTMCSFGVLLLSSTNGVRSFGGIVLIGIILCWILCPLSQARKRGEVI